MVVGSCTRGSQAADDGDRTVAFVDGLPNSSILIQGSDHQTAANQKHIVVVGIR